LLRLGGGFRFVLSKSLSDFLAKTIFSHGIIELGLGDSSGSIGINQVEDLLELIPLISREFDSVIVEKISELLPLDFVVSVLIDDSDDFFPGWCLFGLSELRLDNRVFELGDSGGGSGEVDEAEFAAAMEGAGLAQLHWARAKVMKKMNAKKH